MNATINKDRQWETLMTLGGIGKTAKGGVGRLSLTALDGEARDLFCKWARDAGCDIRIDAIGNIFARRPGRNPSAPPVMTGSHLDSQPLGGKFDGAYGVMAGLEVVRALNDAGVETEAPIDVVNWTDEEGARFAAGCIGSSVFGGQRKLEDALTLTDADNVSVAQALKDIGYAGPEAVGGFPIKAYVEVHIEQGPLLENAGLAVGAVMGAQGQRCFKITVTGEEGHAGTLPMTERKDAFVGAAEMTVALDQLAPGYSPPCVITMGHVRVIPNSRNTIPGTTIFTIDSRHPDAPTLEKMDADIRAVVETIAGRRGLGLHIETVTRANPVTFDDRVIETVRDVCRQRQVRFMDIYSGAGHDACKVAAVAPTGMIFVPCEKGISHNEAENATPEDLAVGTQALLDALVSLANA